MKNIKPGDKVMVPRTGGGYTEGTVLAIHEDRAITEFPVGDTYQGKPHEFDRGEMATKNVAVKKLRPAEKV